MEYRIEMAEAAEQEASAILEWLWSEGAGETGIRWFLGLEGAIASLSTFPRRCPLAPEDPVFPFEVRQLL